MKVLRLRIDDHLTSANDVVPFLIQWEMRVTRTLQWPRHALAAPSTLKTISSLTSFRGVGANWTKTTFLLTRYAVKHLPEWFPGAGFIKDAKETSKLSRAIQFDAHNMTKERMVSPLFEEIFVLKCDGIRRKKEKHLPA